MFFDYLYLCGCNLMMHMNTSFSPLTLLQHRVQYFQLRVKQIIYHQWLDHYICSAFSLINSNKVPHCDFDFRCSLALLNARVHHCPGYFPANGLTNPDVFSLKPSLSQGESSLKISARLGSPFRRSQGTNTQTHSLTDKRFYRVIYF